MRWHNIFDCKLRIIQAKNLLKVKNSLKLKINNLLVLIKKCNASAMLLSCIFIGPHVCENGISSFKLKFLACGVKQAFHSLHKLTV